ncbi:MAG TPA: 30S ribosomal protein S6 [Anaerolineae bacterium]|nr:30S ribosomal protein S6 [Anaerolineae bacterium]
MRTYEFMYIVNPELEQEALEQLTSRIEQMIAAAGGQVLQLRSWGRRRLAFPIRRFHEGHYHVAYLQLEPNAIGDLRGRLALTEEVIRYLLVRTEVVPPGEAPEEVPGEEVALPVEESEEGELEPDGDREVQDTNEEEVGS